ncbi:MAG: DUF4214 domain-containing protein, partial [Solobacterium sp.]|nr:DUF4214 domain-containing protein [Solobacterium sp.]
MKKLWIVCLVIMACISSNLMVVNAEEETIKEEVKEYKSQINFRSIPSTQPTLNGFTVRLYRNVLNREPDQNGFTYWTERLKQKKVTGIEILQQFFNSDELKKKNLNSTKFMELLYQTALNRKADAS